ncbi:MAG: hypothetical protein H6737_29310 [Alphaproteobacteria bacterium]|nr:hypothetical protein [Alphaproteobacteria bacterium]
MGSSSEDLKAILRTRGARWTLGILATAVVVGGGATWWVMSHARSTHCDIAKHEPLSMEQLIDVKKRFTAYKRDPDAGITLTGPELSMLLEDRADVPVYVDVKGEHLHAQIAVPASDTQCYPIDFEGSLAVEGGVAYVTPERLVIGDVDLSALARGVRMELLPENMPTAKAALFLEQTRSASVDGGEMQVELHAPAEFSLNRH